MADTVWSTLEEYELLDKVNFLLPILPVAFPHITISLLLSTVTMHQTTTPFLMVLLLDLVPEASISTPDMHAFDAFLTRDI